MWLKKILDFLGGPEEPEEEKTPAREDKKPITLKEEAKPSSPPPKTPKIKPPEEELQLEKRSPYVKKILKEFYIPYRHSFDTQRATEGLLLLVEFLDQEGDCPSIVRNSKEPEERLLNKLASPFQKVSLKEHSLNVAREIVKLINPGLTPESQNSFSEPLIPEGVIIALGHDLGKIPSVRDQKFYLKADHPILSALKLEEIFSKVTPPHWIENAKDCIKNHHRPSSTTYTTLTTYKPLETLLKEADRRARELEILKCHPDLKPRPPKTWPDPKKILQLIVPLINKIQPNNKFAAFSWGSIIFVQPDALYDAAKKLAIEEKIVSWDLLLESEKRRIEIQIVDALRKERMLAEEIPQGLYGRVCEIEYPKRTTSMILVPIKIEALEKLPSQIIRTYKHGHLAKIQSVKINPLKPPWERRPFFK